MRIPKLLLTFAFILIITAGSCRKAPEPIHTGDYGRMHDLILTELSGNGKTGLPEARLHPFTTGPAMLRINLGDTQYMLTRPKPPNDPVSPPTRPK